MLGHSILITRSALCKHTHTSINTNTFAKECSLTWMNAVHYTLTMLRMLYAVLWMCRPVMYCIHVALTNNFVIKEKVSTYKSYIKVSAYQCKYLDLTGYVTTGEFWTRVSITSTLPAKLHLAMQENPSFPISPVVSLEFETLRNRQIFPDILCNCSLLTKLFTESYSQLTHSIY